MIRPTVGDISLALFALPKAGYSPATTARKRVALYAALGSAPQQAVYIAIAPGPRGCRYAREIVRDVLNELAACAAQEVAA